MAARKPKPASNAVKLGVVGAGLAVGGFALYKYFSGGSTATASATQSLPPTTVPTATTASTKAKSTPSSVNWAEGTFPLLPSSTRNKKVLALQKAIIALGGEPARLLINAGGADGIFGKGTAAALKAASANPQMVTEATYNGFLQKATTGIAPAPGVPADIVDGVLKVRTEIMAFDTDEMAIIGVFAAKNDAWLKAFQTAYNARYGKNKLIDDLKRDVGNDFKTLVDNLERLNIQFGVSGTATNGIPAGSANLSLLY